MLLPCCPMLRWVCLNQSIGLHINVKASSPGVSCWWSAPHTGHQYITALWRYNKLQLTCLTFLSIFSHWLHRGINKSLAASGLVGEIRTAIGHRDSNGRVNSKKCHLDVYTRALRCPLVDVNAHLQPLAFSASSNRNLSWVRINARQHSRQPPAGRRGRSRISLPSAMSRQSFDRDTTCSGGDSASRHTSRSPWAVSTRYFSFHCLNMKPPGEAGGNWRDRISGGCQGGRGKARVQD